MKKLWRTIAAYLMVAILATSYCSPIFAEESENGNTYVMYDESQDEPTDQEDLDDSDDSGEDGADDEEDSSSLEGEDSSAEEEEEEEESEPEDQTEEESEGQGEGIQLQGETDEESEPDSSVNFVVEDIDGFVYGAGAVVKDLNGNVLVQDQDYKISYVWSGGVKYTKVVGLGAYYGEIQKPYAAPKTINYSGATRADADVQLVYNGKPQTPPVVVVVGEETLVEGKDYTLTYGNNINAGTAYFRVVGRGRYAGTVTKNFSIARADNKITASTITITTSELLAKKQKISIPVKTKDTDAKISFSNEDSKANFKFDSDKKTAEIPRGFIGTHKVRIKAAKTKNYNAAEKVIKVKVTLDKYPYTSKTTVYTTYKKVGNAILKNFNAHKKSFKINFKIKTTMDKYSLNDKIDDYVKYHQIKSYPFLTYREFGGGVQMLVSTYELFTKYNGYAYGTLKCTVDYEISKTKKDAFVADMKAVLKSIGATSGSSYSRAKKIYAWITKNIRYAFKSDGVTPDTKYNSAYMTFKYKKGVCDGYARLLKAMCALVGVNCKYVVGKESHGLTHAWCIIQDGDEFYQCDACWDAGNSQANWKYFMRKYNKSFWRSQIYHETIASEWLKYNSTVVLAK